MAHVIAEAIQEPLELVDLLSFMEHRQTAQVDELYDAMGGRGLDIIAGLIGCGFTRWTEAGFRLCRTEKDWAVF